MLSIIHNVAYQLYVIHNNKKKHTMTLAFALANVSADASGSVSSRLAVLLAHSASTQFRNSQ